MFTALRASLQRTAISFLASEPPTLSVLGLDHRYLCDTTNKEGEPDSGNKEEVGGEGDAKQEAPVEGGGNQGEDDEPQLAYYEAWHRRGRYPSREEIGNYSDTGTLDAEALLDWEAKGDGPRGTRLYDLPKWLRHNMPEHAPRPRIKGLLAEALKDEEIKELHEYITHQEQSHHENNKPSIFKWEIQFVLSVGGENHPANRKVKLRVYMKELQEHYGIDDEAVQHICRICQKRYNPENGLLTLSVEKYPLREDNRRECMRIIEQLVIEGMKKSSGKEGRKEIEDLLSEPEPEQVQTATA